MLIFAVDYRPSGSLLWQQLSVLYQPLHGQLMQGTIVWPAELHKLTLYIDYNVNRLQLFLDLC